MINVFNIAICDDEVRCVGNLEKIVSAFFDKNNIAVNIEKYYDGTQMLKEEKHFDLIFMDIEMQDSNGISVGMEIRKTDNYVPIVYITSYADYSRRAYKVHAFDFITKPLSIEAVTQTLKDVIKYFNFKNDAKNVELFTGNGVEIQPLDEVIYFILLEKRRVQVNTSKKIYVVKENLSDIYSKIQNDGFYQTNRSCIVNLRHVQSIRKDDGVIMDNGEWLPLATKKQKDFLNKLSQILRS